MKKSDLIVGEIYALKTGYTGKWRPPGPNDVAKVKVLDANVDRQEKIKVKPSFSTGKAYERRVRVRGIEVEALEDLKIGWRENRKKGTKFVLETARDIIDLYDATIERYNEHQAARAEAAMQRAAADSREQELLRLLDRVAGTLGYPQTDWNGLVRERGYDNLRPLELVDLTDTQEVLRLIARAVEHADDVKEQFPELAVAAFIAELDAQEAE